MNSIWAFDSWAAFFQMGGHGLYVWASYGLFFGSLFLLMLGSWLQFNGWKQREKRRLSRLQQQAHFVQGQVNES